MPVNSLMSAPAMKPLFLAEISTRPRGGSRSSAASCSSSSASTGGREHVGRGVRLVEGQPGDALGVAFEFPGRGGVGHGGSRLRGGGVQAAEAGRAVGAAVHLEVAHQRAVIGEAHVGDAKVRDLDALAHQHEIQLDARDARRKGGQPGGVGAAQARGAHEQVDLVRAPEGIEVAGDDHRLGGLADQVVQRAQLVLAVAVLQRQVHQEHAHVRELELDDQPLDAGVEVVEALPVHRRGGQEGVALLAHDRHELVERVRAVLALVGGVVAELARRCGRPG